ncbi:conserved protein of unknown function [Limnospira indica PCC 8005]|uniref:Uncharacterized protein n=1 Tax=Limnospira indica PCC 8005 TaxID=376219 RepID=A0A9P1KLN8_9CYAN|nr:conserved protein of unknown function [Limnospira indica PCC 8005]
MEILGILANFLYIVCISKGFVQGSGYMAIARDDSTCTN